MKAMKKVIQTFYYVLSGSIISTAVFITIFLPGLKFSIGVVWQVIAMSAITSCGTLLFSSKEEIGKKQMRVRMVIHYIYINVVVLGTAILCGWIDVTRIMQIVAMVLLTAGVYFGVNTAMYNNERRTAENINKRLRKIYSEEEKDEV